MPTHVRSLLQNEFIVANMSVVHFARMNWHVLKKNWVYLNLHFGFITYITRKAKVLMLMLWVHVQQ